MITGLVYLPAALTGPLATAASYLAIVAILAAVAVANAGSIHRWHRRAHPVLVRFALALIIAAVIATVIASASVPLPACVGRASWYCWLATFGLF